MKVNQFVRLFVFQNNYFNDLYFKKTKPRLGFFISVSVLNHSFPEYHNLKQIQDHEKPESQRH